MTDKFANLKSEVSDCAKCSLSSTRNKVVFDGGNPDAEIFVIAEGPGYEEDLQGIPFVGKSGKLPDTIFAALALPGKSTCISVILLSVIRPATELLQKLNKLLACFIL